MAIFVTREREISRLVRCLALKSLEEGDAPSK